MTDARSRPRLRRAGGLRRLVGTREARAVLLRRHAEAAQEAAAQALLVAEAAAEGDARDRRLGLLERAARRVDAQALDRLRRRRAHAPGIDAREVARAHGDARGERRDAEIVGEMLRQPVVQRGEAAIVTRLALEQGAELRLATRALEEDDEMARHAQGHGAAEILLDQSQRQVDAGGDAGGGPDLAVAQEDRVGLDGDAGVAPLQGVAGAPMRDSAPSVEQARLRQQEGAGADGADAPRLPRALADPSDERALLHRRARAEPAHG